MKKCSIANCFKKHEALNFCGLHYQRFKKYGKPFLPEKQIKNCIAPQCNAKAHAKSMCEKHYRRISVNGTLELKINPLIGSKECLIKKIKQKVRIEEGSDCWIWKGRLKSDGYAQVCFNGKSTGAHRAAYQIFKGSIPNGLYINHLCHKRSCVNPEHLYAGTAADNSRDMVLAGRSFRGIGEKHSQARLCTNEVIFIKNELRKGAKLLDLANQFNVSFGHISAIKLGKKWKHINTNSQDELIALTDKLLATTQTQ